MLTQNRKKGIVMVLIGASLWGGSGVAGQYILQTCNFSTEWLVAVRMLLSGVILLLVDSFTHKGSIFDIWKENKNKRDLLIFALPGMLAVQYCYFASIKVGNAPAATVLQYLMPIVLIFWIACTQRKLPRAKEVLAVILAVGGTFLLVTHGSLETLSIPAEAVFWGVTSAFAGAVYTLTPKRMIREWRATLVVGWGLFAGGVGLSFICPPWNFSGIWNMAAALNFAYIVIFGTVIAFAMYLGSTKYLEPSEVSILASMEPLSSIVFSVLLLGTLFGPMDVLGTICILSTVLILSK